MAGSGGRLPDALVGWRGKRKLSGARSRLLGSPQQPVTSVPESLVPAASRGAENTSLSALNLGSCCCTEIYSLRYAVVETGDAGESIEPEESH